jgi:hypothetical protein
MTETNGRFAISGSLRFQACWDAQKPFLIHYFGPPSEFPAIAYHLGYGK